MALSPHPSDPNHGEVKKHIESLKKEGGSQNKQKLKDEFNIDADGKSTIAIPSSSQTAKINGK